MTVYALLDEGKGHTGDIIAGAEEELPAGSTVTMHGLGLSCGRGRNVAQHSRAQHSTMWHSIAWYGMALHSMVWHGPACYGMAWHVVPAQVSCGLEQSPTQDQYIPPLDPQMVYLSQTCIRIYRLY